MPGPGVLDDRRQIGVARPPAQLAVSLAGGGHQLGRIARPPWRHMGQQAPPGDRLGGFDHLLHRIAGAVAQVVDQRLAGGLAALPQAQQALQPQHVGIGQITDMDVVADAGAIRRRIVIPEDLQIGTLAAHHIEHQRDQMGFRLMVLAQITGRISTGRIEIAEDHARQAIGATEIVQQLLHHPLAAPIGIDRLLRMLLGDRHLLRHAVGGAGGGEHDRDGLRQGFAGLRLTGRAWPA